MGCFEDIIYSRFLDNDLNPTQEGEILDHLNTCQKCQSLVEYLKKENLAIKKIFHVDHKNPDLIPKLMRKINQDDSNSKISKIHFLTPRRILVTAAALCLTIFLFLLFVMNKNSGQQLIEQEVLIQNARVEGKPVMTHVFNAKDLDLKFIWLEKI